jgi:hypothetical protein
MLAMIVERRDSIGAHALVLHDLEMPISEHQSRNARGRSSIDGWRYNVLLVVALGAILTICWSCRVSVESRRAKVLSSAERIWGTVARLRAEIALTNAGLSAFKKKAR